MQTGFPAPIWGSELLHKISFKARPRRRNHAGMQAPYIKSRDSAIPLPTADRG